MKTENEYIIAGDEVVDSKAGKKTCGLDRFFSGIQQQVITGLSFFTFSLVNVRSADALANQMLNGIDINGNETIEPIPGEGGAITAYEHAGYMSDMPIMAGENKVPPKGQ